MCLVFQNFKYSDNLKTGSQILRVDEISLMNKNSENSLLQNITIEGSEINFFSFRGFKDVGITDKSQLFLLLIQNCIFRDNLFVNEGSLLSFERFINENNALIQIEDSSFVNNYFSAGGQLIKSNLNSKNAVILQNSTFIHNFQAIILLQAVETLRTDIPSVLVIDNCNFSNNFPLIEALVKLKSNSKVIVTQSNFEKTISISRGSIFLGDYQKAEIRVMNSTFKNNFAVDGGIFFVHYESKISIDQSVFEQNLAYSGSIGVIENQGLSIIMNTLIKNNHGIKNSILSVLDAINNQQILDNCTIELNHPVSLKNIQSEVQTIWGSDIFYNQINWQNDRVQMLEQHNLDEIQISISKSNLRISNTVIANTSSFTDFNYSEQSIIHKQYLIESNLQSNVLINNSQIANTTIMLINSASTDISIQNSNIQNINYFNQLDRLFKVDSAHFTIYNSTVINIQSQGQMLIEIQRSLQVNLTLTTFQNFNTNLLSIISSISIFTTSNFVTNQNELTLITDKKIMSQRDNRIVFIKYGAIAITNSSFSRGLITENGGAILVVNSILSLINSNFTENQAKQGGALALQCSQQRGGAIAYNKNRPVMIAGNYFDEFNQAKYGNDIAGYPFNVKVLSYTQYPLASGQQYSGTIKVAIVDADSNIITTDNSSQILELNYCLEILKSQMLMDQAKLMDNLNFKSLMEQQSSKICKFRGFQENIMCRF
ncbi:UNKNOWN [Stylonychia lemnae]|uniref:Uncharacterized protein n=1 Tax=Stylonychia lemnae TaxID=5949 RepID=A0A078A3B3_STYLE|nr:UNKNOWN [Stylonychia lemnae]|eukprot:CDW76657.1 UNKNOWN [Stylonychia lemnae]